MVRCIYALFMGAQSPSANDLAETLNDTFVDGMSVGAATRLRMLLCTSAPAKIIDSLRVL